MEKLKSLPLTEKVGFKTPLQRGGRVQIPKILRWRYKLERWQIFYVTVDLENRMMVYRPQYFLAQMSKDGRITIPKVIQQILAQKQQCIEGHILIVTIEPS